MLSITTALRAVVDVGVANIALLTYFAWPTRHSHPGYRWVLADSALAITIVGAIIELKFHPLTWDVGFNIGVVDATTVLYWVLAHRTAATPVATIPALDPSPIDEYQLV